MITELVDASPDPIVDTKLPAVPSAPVTDRMEPSPSNVPQSPAYSDRATTNPYPVPQGTRVEK